MKMRHLISVVALTLFAGALHAQTTQDSEDGADNTSRALADFKSTRAESGWIPALSFGFGHLDQTGNVESDGDGAIAQLVGTYYFENSNWLADAGVGIQRQYFNVGDESNPILGLISFSGRYEFPERWSIGPTADLLVGDGEQLGTANDYLTMFGLIGFKEIMIQNDQLLRLGLKATTEGGIDEQSGTFVGVVLQWGVGSQNTVVQDVTSNSY